MRTTAILTIVFLITSCSHLADSEVKDVAVEVVDTINLPNNFVAVAQLEFDKSTSLWSHDESLFSGYGLSYYPDSTLKEKFGIVDGRRQNESLEWFPDAHLKFSGQYHKGKLHGEKKVWSSDPQHVLLSQLNFFLGQAHGVQKKWYSTGELFLVLRYEMGKERGMQQAYRKNGALYANYETINGRHFGLSKSKPCFAIEDQVVQYERD